MAEQSDNRSVSPDEPRRRGVVASLIRSVVIAASVVAFFIGLLFLYGVGPEIGAVIGVVLVLTAVRKRYIARAVLAVLAAIVICLTLLGTQSAYQYARWHADEVVAAGSKLMDQCPQSDFHGRTIGSYAFFGEEIQPSDPRVPAVLRKLGARRIWVDAERVAVYVGTNEFDFSTFPRPEIEFQIYRAAHPATHDGFIWGSPGKGSTKFTDRLWTNLY